MAEAHSFCNFVIENYFHRIGLDPSFRQATQTEGEMLFSGRRRCFRKRHD